MAQPVWVLSVDLQAKTATFQTGMSDAARSARGAFNEIGGSAEQGGRRVGGGMMEARHSIMLLGEEFGIHIPRALATFIASLGPVGAALDAAFPFLAVIVGATLLIEHLNKMREAGQKLTEDQIRFGNATENAFNTLDKKLIEAEKRADELRGDHLGALQHQLELIDKESLEELVHSFESVAKAADVVMKDLEGHWYTFGKGSDGAKHALDDFQTRYESLLAQGKQEEAGGLLKGTLGQAQKVLTALKDKSAYEGASGSDMTDDLFQKGIAAQKVLKGIHVETGVAFTNQIAAQDNLVQALEAQARSEQRIADIKKLEQGNAKTSTSQTIDKEAEAAAKKKQEEQDRLDREYLSNFKHEQQDLINVTREGTAERLSALQAAMEATASMYGRDNETYKQYAVEYLRTWNEAAAKTLDSISKELDEEDRLKAEAGREQAANDERMGELSLARLRQSRELARSLSHTTYAQQMADAEMFANEEFAIKYVALQREIDALDKSGKDYENHLKALQDKETQLTRQHENELTSIKEKAEQESNQRILAAENQRNDAIARGLTQSITGHETWAKMVTSLGDQVVSGMMENAIKSALLDDFDKERDAAKAARKGWLAGSQFPFPTNIVMAPLLAASSFAAVMAFEGGTDRVPGIGRGDVVPTLLTPGEGVVPGGVMDGLRTMAKNGGFDGGGPRNHVTMQVHMHASALDAEGMDKVLEKHSDKLQRHFENTLRKMNR